MILYTVLAIGWLAAGYFHPVLFALLDGWHDIGGRRDKNSA
ncbi:hypothetical protein [Mesorhizobium sp. B2-3-5]|nr:hypothetical protein [Mesorhizobium sp. B2-3-5]